jgi:hypothetical protein
MFALVMVSIFISFVIIAIYNCVIIIFTYYQKHNDYIYNYVFELAKYSVFITIGNNGHKYTLLA